MTDTRRDSLLSAYSDMHKDARGYRPTGSYQNYTLEQLESDMENFERSINESYEDDKIRYAQNLTKFNDTVKVVQDIGNIDRATAIRWMMQADDERDLDFWLWNQGLGYEDSNTIAGELKA